MADKVKVYLSATWDDEIGSIQISRRAATLEAIELSNAKPITETVREVDPSEIDENGFLRQDPNPSRR